MSIMKTYSLLKWTTAQDTTTLFRNLFLTDRKLQDSQKVILTAKARGFGIRCEANITRNQQGIPQSYFS